MRVDTPARAITLPDGRRLSYEEYGHPQGEPVFYFHGSPGSRVEARLAHDAAVAAHVRVIAPDRPGYGGSDFQPGRRIDDWPHDVAVLADTLGIQRFALIGLSGGGPHALACAIAMPQCVNAVAVVSSAGPVEAYYARSRSKIGRLIRRASMPIVRAFIGIGVRLLPIALRRTSARRMSTYADKRVLARLEMREAFREELLEAYRPGTRGAVHEFGLHTRPWPFIAASTPIVVYLWHGNADVIVRPDIAHYLAQLLPRCESVFLPSEGHLLIVDHIDEILRTVVRTSTLHATAATTPS